MRKGCINEVKQLQKIAGLLKEDEFDTLDNPLAIRKPSFQELFEDKSFVSVKDDGHYEYDRFGFADYRRNCYMLDLEGNDSDDVYLLKKGLTVQKVVEEGKRLRYFYYYTDGRGYTDLFYRVDFEAEISDWLESLKAEL